MVSWHPALKSTSWFICVHGPERLPSGGLHSLQLKPRGALSHSCIADSDGSRDPGTPWHPPGISVRSDPSRSNTNPWFAVFTLILSWLYVIFLRLLDVGCIVIVGADGDCEIMHFTKFFSLLSNIVNIKASVLYTKACKVFSPLFNSLKNILWVQEFVNHCCVIGENEILLWDLRGSMSYKLVHANPSLRLALLCWRFTVWLNASVQLLASWCPFSMCAEHLVCPLSETRIHNTLYLLPQSVFAL